jgi:hypothetical protein
MGRVHKCFIMFWHIDCPVRVVSTYVCHLYMVCGGKPYLFKNFGMVAISVLKCHLWLWVTKVLSFQTQNLDWSALHFVFKSKGKVWVLIVLVVAAAGIRRLICGDAWCWKYQLMIQRSQREIPYNNPVHIAVELLASPSSVLSYIPLQSSSHSVNMNDDNDSLRWQQAIWVEGCGG